MPKDQYLNSYIVQLVTKTVCEKLVNAWKMKIAHHLPAAVRYLNACMNLQTSQACAANLRSD